MSTSKDGPIPSGTTSIIDEAADQIRSRAGDAADGVAAKASSAAQDVNDRAAGLLGTAKTMASDAGGKLEQELPPAATYIRRAADEIDAMADAVQRRDVRQLVGDVQSFARRQPAAFLGATVLGGFAIMRLLKAPTPVHQSGAEPDAGSASTRRTALVSINKPPAHENVGLSTGSGSTGSVPPGAFGSPTTGKSTGARPEVKP